MCWECNADVVRAKLLMSDTIEGEQRRRLYVEEIQEETRKPAEEKTAKQSNKSA